MTHPTILYHYSSPDNRESILKRGLCTVFDQTGMGAIFLTDVHAPQQSDCWEVDVKGLADIEPDQTTEAFSGENWWVYDGNISPRRIRRIGPDGTAQTSPPQERTYGMFAAATGRPERPWKNIYGLQFQVEMCSEDPVAVEVRILAAAVPGCYFAWHDFREDELSLVYYSEDLVRMCDPGAFGPAIARGDGNVVPVDISSLGV